MEDWKDYQDDYQEYQDQEYQEIPDECLQQGWEQFQTEMANMDAAAPVDGGAVPVNNAAAPVNLANPETINAADWNTIAGADMMRDLYNTMPDVRAEMVSLCRKRAKVLGISMKSWDDIWKSYQTKRKKSEKNRALEAAQNRHTEKLRALAAATRGKEIDYIYIDEKGKEHVDEPRLTDYFRETVHYRLVQDNTKKHVMFYVYDGGCYRLTSDLAVMGMIGKMIDAYDKGLRKADVVKRVFQGVQRDSSHICDLSAFNTDQRIINFRDGLLYVDADEIKFMAHTPKVLSTIQIPCNAPVKPMPTPVYDRYMRDLLGYVDDEDDRIELVEEFLGLTISGYDGTRPKKALILEGPGDVGKSQIRNLLNEIIGSQNSSAIDLGRLEERFGPMAIVDKRVIGSPDMEYLTVSQLSTFKTVTGGDHIMVEIKGGGHYDYRYNGTLFFCCNRRPKFTITDDDLATYSRIMLVTCHHKPTGALDSGILDKMLAESQGVLYRWICALQRLIRRGFFFKEPKGVIEERAKYMVQNSSVLGFCEECLLDTRKQAIDEPVLYLTHKDAYQVYRRWCVDNNNGHAIPKKEFGRQVARWMGCDDIADAQTAHKISGSVFWTYKYVGLRKSAEQCYCDTQRLSISKFMRNETDVKNATAKNDGWTSADSQQMELPFDDVQNITPFPNVS